MKSIMRRYQKAEDYSAIRRFLREVFLINNREQSSWDVARFDYWRWHGILNMKDGTLEDDVFIWENEKGEIKAVLNREAPGSVFLQIHPDFRSHDLLMEMLSTAEKHLTVPIENDRRSLHVWAEAKDRELQDLLKYQGYIIKPESHSEHQRRRFLSHPVSPVPVADGYVIRAMGDIEDHPAREWLSFRAFHPNEPDSEFKPDWYKNIQKAPLYRRDLDLVAVAPDGEFAAFCTIWFDDHTGMAHYEPVGTSSDHQRKGLGKAILTEGLIRLKTLGAEIAMVGSYSEPAHSLYASVGFETYRILESWTKEL